MDYRERVVCNSGIMLGKPVIKGTRITVEIVLRRLSEGDDIEQIISSYPNLTKEDILAVLSYSADVISREEMIAA
jgi:uncharacterized protein (DUF433 family)